MPRRALPCPALRNMWAFSEPAQVPLPRHALPSQALPCHAQPQKIFEPFQTMLRVPCLAQPCPAGAYAAVPVPTMPSENLSLFRSCSGTIAKPKLARPLPAASRNAMPLLKKLTPAPSAPCAGRMTTSLARPCSHVALRPSAQKNRRSRGGHGPFPVRGGAHS